jgi:hypothetical protein
MSQANALPGFLLASHLASLLLVPRCCRRRPQPKQAMGLCNDVRDGNARRTRTGQRRRCRFAKAIDTDRRRRCRPTYFHHRSGCPASTWRPVGIDPAAAPPDGKPSGCRVEASRARHGDHAGGDSFAAPVRPGPRTARLSSDPVLINTSCALALPPAGFAQDVATMRLIAGDLLGATRQRRQVLPRQQKARGAVVPFQSGFAPGDGGLAWRRPGARRPDRGSGAKRRRARSAGASGRLRRGRSNRAYRPCNCRSFISAARRIALRA